MNNQDRLIIEKEQLNDLVNSCQEEIRRLKEENQRLKEQIRKYKDLGFEYLCKENQRLNDDIKILFKENEAKEKVIIKQDNVLNELEKWLIEDNYKNEDVWCITTQEVLKKIKELKESDK